MMHDLVLFAPVIILALGALFLVPFAAFTEDARGTTWLAAAVSLIAAFWAFKMPVTGGAFMNATGPLALITPMTLVVWTVMFVAFPFAMALVEPFFKKGEGDKARGVFKPEFAILCLLSLCGMAVLVTAHDFLTLYVALELMSFPLYILCAFARDDARSSEAGLKYFVLGALASGLFLFGVSLGYAATGSTNFTNVLSVAMGAGQETLPLAAVSMALVVLAMVFKLSVAPFHVWTPDAYQGAPMPVTAFMASLPKLAVLVLLMRLLGLPFATQVELWQPLLMGLAIVSMFLGSAVAVVQHDLKRLLAYSTIGNVGFIMVGVATGTPGASAGVLFYAVAYLVNTLGLFATITALGKVQPVREDLAGLVKTRPWLTGALIVNLLSLAGIPPLAGFMGKFSVFGPAVAAGHAWLAVVGVLASGVALFYSLYLIKLAVFDAPVTKDKAPRMALPLRVVVGVSVVFAIVFGLYPQPLVQVFQTAASGLF